MISKLGPAAISLALSLLLLAVAMGRILSTHDIFVQTTDEPAHIATGLEWLDNGTYIYEPHHPPLSRIILALGPYLDGVRLSPEQQAYLHDSPDDMSKRYRWGWYYHNLYRAMWDTGNYILYEPGSYFRTLSLARSGNLVFFFAAGALVWFWTKTLFGSFAAAVATAIFATLPPILGHAGLATTDMALTCTFLLSIVTFCQWLNSPTRKTAILFGIAGALAIVSKFSSLLYFPSCAAFLIVWRLLIAHKSPRAPKPASTVPRYWARSLATAALSAALVIWSVYLFSLGPIKPESSRPHESIDSIVGTEGPLHDFAYSLVELPLLPAPELFAGINQVAQHNEGGHRSYLLGEVEQTGWWYFFPVVLTIKTPIPILILGALGIILTLVVSKRESRWDLAAPGLCVLAIMAASMFSNINIGVRHILPLYPFLAVSSAYSIIRLWNGRRFRTLGRIVACTLLSWQMVNTSFAHPDYLPYFNEFAGNSPEDFLIDSDLDWGQDLARLASYLRKEGITDISLAYQGTADPTKHDLPEFRILRPEERASGWIAASLFKLRVREGYSWLEQYEPTATVGKSIRLYNIPQKRE